MIGISIRQLEVFGAIAAAGTVRAAAQRLFATQPAVSMALSELERQLNAQLFDRERGRLHLSPRGKELLPMAQEIIERLHEMMRQTGEQPLALTGELRVGASNTIGRSEEHTSELQSLMRISYAVFCLKKKNRPEKNNTSLNTYNSCPDTI